MTWTVVFVVAVVVIGAVWIGGTVRWTARNGMLRRAPQPSYQPDDDRRDGDRPQDDDPEGRGR